MKYNLSLPKIKLIWSKSPYTPEETKELKKQMEERLQASLIDLITAIRERRSRKL